MTTTDMLSLGVHHRAYKPSSYLEAYQVSFGHLKDRPIRLLEVGILSGASLLMWRDYFPNGTVTGIDLALPTLADARHIAMYAGDQGDLELLDRVGAERGPFDIIVDDCAHIRTVAEPSFWRLFCDHLVPGGTYAIEDWGTGYWESWPDGAQFVPDHTAGMVGFVKSLVDECGRGLSGIERIELKPGLALVRKGGG